MPELMVEKDEKRKLSLGEYLETFYEPEFTSYDFMCLFGAIKASQRNFSFSRDNLVKFIALCKTNNQFSRLLDDIQIKNNGVFDFSENLDDAILKLKLGKIFYTISPEADSTMMIFEDIPMAKLIEKRIAYFDEMVNFLEYYDKFEIDITNQIQHQLSKKRNGQLMTN